jgi:hypothetical protein
MMTCFKWCILCLTAAFAAILISSPENPPLPPQSATVHTYKEATATTAQPNSHFPALSKVATAHQLRAREQMMEKLPQGRLRTEIAALDTPARNYALDRLLAAPNLPREDCNSLHVLPTGALYYACSMHDHGAHRALPKGAQASSLALPDSSVTPAISEGVSVPITSPPIRHSLPGSKTVIHLDFNGRTIMASAWNNQNNPGDILVAKPYDTDGNPTTFSATEQAAIIEIWERVAEDYAIFNVDVTTEEPSSLTRNSFVVISAPMGANGIYLPGTDAQTRIGGIALVWDFDPKYSVSKNAIAGKPDPIAFVYDNGGTTPAHLADAISHEVGHQLGLFHQGQTLPNGVRAEYYDGHGSGANGWGAIMGSGAPYPASGVVGNTSPGKYSQWTKGEYAGSSGTFSLRTGPQDSEVFTTIQDDIAVITSVLGLRPSVVGKTLATASVPTDDGQIISQKGILSQQAGDYYAFNWNGGVLSLTAASYHVGSSNDGTNAYFKIDILDANGSPVATSTHDETLGTATINNNIAEGAYYIHISPIGKGSPLEWNDLGTIDNGEGLMIPLAPSAIGWTSYGSLGQYLITGNIPRQVQPTPPVFDQQPAAQSAVLGSSVTLTAHAVGYPEPTYQWFKNGVSIQGQTGGTLVLASAQLTDIGSYSVTATNGSAPAGVASNQAVLTVSIVDQPYFTEQPASRIAKIGGAITLSVAAVNATKFQWRKNGTPIANATSATLTLNPATVNSAGLYDAIASNDGTLIALSITATVQVIHPTKKTALPRITAQPVAAKKGTLGVSENLTLSVKATTTIGTLLGYQWRKNGQPLAGETNTTLTVNNLTVAEAGRYDVVVSNASGSTVSKASTVNVMMAPLQLPNGGTLRLEGSGTDTLDGVLLQTEEWDITTKNFEDGDSTTKEAYGYRRLTATTSRIAYTCVTKQATYSETLKSTITLTVSGFSTETQTYTGSYTLSGSYSGKENGNAFKGNLNASGTFYLVK